MYTITTTAILAAALTICGPVAMAQATTPVAQQGATLVSTDDSNNDNNDGTNTNDNWGTISSNKPDSPKTEHCPDKPPPWGGNFGYELGRDGCKIYYREN